MGAQRFDCELLFNSFCVGASGKRSGWARSAGGAGCCRWRSGALPKETGSPWRPTGLPIQDKRVDIDRRPPGHAPERVAELLEHLGPL